MWKSKFWFFLITILLFSTLPQHTSSDTNSEIGKFPASDSVTDVDNSVMLQPGNYLVENQLITNDMQVTKTLKTIPYSMVQLQNQIPSQNGIFPNTEIQLDLFSAGSQGNLMNFDSSSMNDLWSAGYNGTGVVIAIVDTGIDFDHPAIFGKRVDERSFHKIEYGFDEDKDAKDTHGHGTSVASIAAGFDGNFKGTAFEAKLVNARIGLTQYATTTTLSMIAALDWVINLESVDIISLSLSEIEEGYSFDPLELMVNTGVQQGKIILTSAGNSASNSKAGYQIGSPSSAPEVISVGASTGTGLVSDYSSRGPTYAGEAKPDIVGPGNNINGAVLSGGYDDRLSGTSFSTPLVSGIMATLTQAMDDLGHQYTPGVMKSLLLRGASDIGNNHYSQGFGVVNASKSFELIQASSFLPVIGPSSSNINQIEYTVPLNTPVSIPLTFIGFELTSFSITSVTNQVEINYQPNYLGDTTIIDLEVKLLQNISESNIELQVDYEKSNQQLNYHYFIPIQIVPEPDYRVLLDLKHTLYDTIFDKNSLGERLERLGQDDIIPLYNSIRKTNGWVEELIQDFSYELLSQYDIVWIPSAFSTSVEPLYDHIYQQAVLDKADLFTLARYIDGGGSLIIDYNGLSSYDQNIAVEYDQMSLQMLASLLGIEITDNIGSDPTTNLSIESLFVSNATEIANGEDILYNGMIFTPFETGGSGIATMDNTGGRVYLHNSRNWRAPHSSIDLSNNYMSDVIEFVSKMNNSLTGYSLGNEGIVLSGLKDYSSNEFNIELLENGVQITDYQLQFEGNTLEIQTNLSTNSLIRLNLSTLDNQLLYVVDRVDPPVSLPTSVEIMEIEDNYKLVLVFDKINFLSSTAWISSPTHSPLSGYVSTNQYIIDILDQSFDLRSLLSYNFEFVDLSGNYIELQLSNYLTEDKINSLITTPENRVSSSSVESSSMTLMIYVALFVLVRANKIKKFKNI